METPDLLPSRGALSRRARPGPLAALVIAVVAFAYQQTAVTPAIPTIQEDLGASQTWSAWLITGYLLVTAVAVPFVGKLSDRFGHRRLMLAALGVFFLGSIGAAAAPSFEVLIGFRGFQGVGGAVFPLALAMVRDELPAERVGFGIGVLTGAFGAGTALGFGTAGVLVTELSWRWIFGLGALTVALGSLAIATLVEARPSADRRRLDTPGAVLLGGGLGLFLLAVTEGVPRGWDSLEVVGSFSVSILLLAAWVRRELRTPEPLIDIRVLGSRAAVLTNAASLLLGYTLFGTYFLIPYLVRAPGEGEVPYGFGAGPVATGIFLLPAALGQIVGGPLAGPLSTRFGAKRPFAAGMAVCALAALALAVLKDSAWQLALCLGLLGFGIGLSIAVSSALVTEVAREEETGVATAVNNVVRRVGGGIGGQVGAALLAGLTLAGSGAPAGSAFVAAFLVTSVLALAGAGFALLLPTGAEVSTR